MHNSSGGKRSDAGSRILPAFPAGTCRHYDKGTTVGYVTRIREELRGFATDNQCVMPEGSQGWNCLGEPTGTANPVFSASRTIEAF